MRFETTGSALPAVRRGALHMQTALPRGISRRPAFGDLRDYAGACVDDEALLRDDAAAHRPRFCSAIADAQD
jgi:hypothetical protein